MSKEKLLKYPKKREVLPTPDTGDFFTWYGFDETSTRYINEKKIKGKGVVVYLLPQSQLDVVCRHDLIICGYRQTSILRSKKIKPIPIEDREHIKSDLVKNLTTHDFKHIEFWNPI